MKKHLSVFPLQLLAGMPPRRIARALGFAVGLITAGPTLNAAGTPGSPPPGQYRIDSETTTTSRAGPTTIQSVQRIDGTTGQVTLTQKSSVDPANVATRTMKGDGPNGWCVPQSGAMPPPRAMPGACENVDRTQTPGGSKQRADCNAGRFDEQWRRVDDRTWDRWLRVRQASAVSNVSPQPALELAMRGMTPQDRARAQAEMADMPSAADMASARTTLVATLEQQARTGSPAEAAAARQQLAAMRGSSPAGAGEAGVVVEIRERWTRVADTCRAGG
jgi:hypothetical protein